MVLEEVEEERWVGHHQDASDRIRDYVSLWRGSPHPGRCHTIINKAKSEPMVTQRSCQRSSSRLEKSCYKSSLPKQTKP